jgi:hypothetical protein
MKSFEKAYHYKLIQQMKNAQHHLNRSWFKDKAKINQPFWKIKYKLKKANFYNF